MGGREGKCGVRVENNTRSVNKARQRTTMKQSIYWHVFFIKYVTTVIVRDEVVNKARRTREAVSSASSSRVRIVFVRI